MFAISETLTAVGIPIILVVLGIIIAVVMGKGR
jgi:hypothetical protein